MNHTRLQAGWRGIALMALFLDGICRAWGYPVGPPAKLEKLADEADVIFKGTAISSQPAQDEWFKPVHDFVTRETCFRIVSLVKGDAPDGLLRFRHYDENPQPQGRAYEPQHYHFNSNETYLVFARKTGEPAVFRQLWAAHTGKEDQGVLWCAGPQSLETHSARDAMWTELTRMLKDADAVRRIYAIRQLDQMSGWGDAFDSTADFDRTNVLAAVCGIMRDADPAVAQAALTVVGSHNPYMAEERAEHWLATVGSGDVPGLSKMNAGMTNIGGRLYRNELVALVNGGGPAGPRALAIRALGLVRDPSLKEPALRWTEDPDGQVRAAAAVLLADYPGPESLRRLAALARDPAPGVRSGAAHAIGFSQQAELAGVLGELIVDTNAGVRRAASMSLLSFSPKQESIARAFKAQLDRREFQPLFLNALARENPEAWLEPLARVIEEKPEPQNWGGGQVPAFTAWQILFKYLQAQEASALREGKLDRYLDALEKVGNYSSSEPRDIYALYLQRGMSARAAAFRQKAVKAASYDLEYYFRQVDQNPALYKRE